jgi:Chaperone of endosialidase
MGQIVFQATLGGQTALVGQNTASSYSLTLPLATDTLVGKATTDTLTNKTLTAPVISSIVNTGTLTLPTSTDTLVGRATTDTLTNKTISGSSNTISNISLTSSVTGTLPVGNGGTGLTTLTTGYIPYGNGTSAFSSSANLFWDGTNSRLGLGTVSPSTILDIRLDQNAGTWTKLENQTNGSASSAYMYIAGGQSYGSRALYVGQSSPSRTGTGYFNIAWANTSAIVDDAGTSNGILFGTQASAPIIFGTNATERARIDSSGNLILAGTTASSWTSNGSLTLGGSGGNYGVTIYNGTNTGGLYFASALAGGGRHAGSITYNGTSNAMLFETNSNGTVATLDSSGNLGLGVTPYGWYAGSSAHVFQINNGSFYADSANSVSLASNWGFTTGGAQQYISSSYATRYIQSSGQHIWNIAPSGTAGNAITFTQAMTLTNSGFLGIGLTSPSQALNVSGNARFEATSGNRYVEVVSSTSSIQIGTDASSQYIYGVGAFPLTFSTNGVERARIDSSGNLLVGTTSGFGGIINAVSTGNPLYIKCTTSSQSVGVFWNSQNSTGTSAGLLNFGVGSSYTSVGTVTYNGTLTVYGTTSDQRLKTNIVDAPSGNIDAIKVRSFDWKESNTHQDYGLVAQELIEVAPYAVSKPDNADEMMNIDFSLLVPMMIKEIQDLKQRIATLENK